MAVFQAVTSVLGIAITALIAWLVHDAGREIARIEHARELKNAWMTLDTVVCSNDATLKTADLLLYPDSVDDEIDVRRKRWLCFMLINCLSLWATDLREGIIPPGSQGALENELRALTLDETFDEVLSKYSGEPEFIDLCHRLRAEQLERRERMTQR